IQRAAGLPIERPDLRALLPFFDTRDVVRANFCRLDGVYHPPLVLQALVEEAAGARFRYGEPVRPEAVEAETVVIAAGIWSAEVGAALGVRLAVEPSERGVFALAPFAGLHPDLPLTIDSGAGWGF